MGDQQPDDIEMTTEELSKKHNWSKLLEVPAYHRTLSDANVAKSLMALHTPKRESEATSTMGYTAHEGSSNPNHELYKCIHFWSDKHHVVELAFLVLHCKVPSEWLDRSGKIVDKVRERLKAIIWGRICEWQKPVSNPVRCQFCVSHDLQCFKITLPNPLGQPNNLVPCCTACRSRAKREKHCIPGPEEEWEPRYLGESNWFGAFTADPALGARVSSPPQQNAPFHFAHPLSDAPILFCRHEWKLEQNHFGCSTHYGPTRAEVRGRDCQPLTEEEKGRVMELQWECVLSNDARLRAAHFRLWDALFPVDLAQDIWPQPVSSE